MNYPILFSAVEEITDWDSQGLGVLTDAVKCRVYEEINGQYELTLEYPKTGRHYDEIEKDSIILVKVPNETNKQAFRVYEMEKTLRGTTGFTARHISYDLAGYPVKASSVTKYGIDNALNSLISDAIIVPPFRLTTNKTNTDTQFRVTDIGSIRSWLGGREGSILDKFGGEWHWDNYTCELLNRRGANNGYTIRYAKNLTSLRNLINNEKTYTGVVCVYADADGNTIASDVQSTEVGSLVNIFSVDVSAEYESEPTIEQLNARAQAYIRSAGLNSLDEMSIKLSFVDDPDAMASVGLGDTVTVQCEDLNFSSRIVKSTWDVLLGRYVELTVGKVVATLSDTIHAIENTADLTDTRNVLKLSSSGLVAMRPLNADADMTEEEFRAWKRPWRFYFWPENYFEVFTESIANKIRLPDVDVTEVTAIQHLYRSTDGRLVFKLLSEINNHPSMPSGWAGIEFTEIDIKGTKRDGENEPVNVYLHGTLFADIVRANSLVSVGNTTLLGDLSVAGKITNDQTFTFLSVISPGSSLIRRFPLSWSGIIAIYRDSNEMAMYMLRVDSTGDLYVTPIVSDPDLYITPSGVSQFVKVYNNGTTDARWYCIGREGS